MDAEGLGAAGPDADVPESGGDAPAIGATAVAEAFAAILFRRVPPDDLAALDELGRLRTAATALSHLAQSRPDKGADIRVTDVAWGEGDARREATILEVVNEDRPFLLDSTLGELVARGLEPRLVAHPILAVAREPDGSFRGLAGEAGAPAEGLQRESLIHIHLDRLSETERADLAHALEGVFAEVAAADADMVSMTERLRDLAKAYRSSPPPLPPGEIEEATAFLEWLASGHFTVLGMRAHRIPETEGTSETLEGSGLGLLRDPSLQVLRRGTDLVSVTPEIRAFLERPELLIITKASVQSRVHRRAYLDYVGAKLFGPSGKLWGEFTIVGLFTASAYAANAASVPYLRRKVAAVEARAGFAADSFDGRALEAVLETYPRDELFQIDEDLLHDFALEILRLAEHPRVRVLVRPDRFGRFVSVIVFVPKDRYDTTIRRQIGEFLARSFGGRLSAAYPAYPDGPLARTHLIIGRDGGAVPDVSRETLERGVAAIVRTWGDRLGEALTEGVPGPRARELALRYGSAFGAAYREAFDATQAVTDIREIERLSDEKPRAVDLYRREGDPDERVNLKLFSRGLSLPLSERVPLLERLGFRVVNERTYQVAPGGAGRGERVWLHDMALERVTGQAVDMAASADRIEAALLAVFRGVAESDGYNRLVIEAGLGWRDAALVRTYGRYLQQIAIPYSQDYIGEVLARHGDVVALIVGLFYVRLDPHAASAEEAGSAKDRLPEADAREAIAAGLAAIASLDDDRILRRLLNLVDATVRTNFFHLGPNGLPLDLIAFKFDCGLIDELPKPHPLFEVFMSSPRVEALHLRFGKVARGGIRWTDRPQDFRTEILGLVKAQQVKNAVIVPVGAKGGFFPKQLPPASDRAAWMAEGTEAYRLFIRTLLSITDNLDGDAVVPPPNTVRLDGDDPYLVVAADKGTATFSDTANAISVETGHWLADAFASGGSHGYDHKAMGITARGAWEAVKRHFREMDVDIQAEPVTMVGVGDMSGDVFGNGALLSRHLKLVAAFDHRDIFIDPDPDPAPSFAERERLFWLPRSSWQDYDKSLISTGGGVFPRSAKSIALSPEARAALGIEAAEASPASVMRAILAAPVGLLFFGGIGTYVRASAETDAQAGDRANDAIRLTAADLRCRVIGEGANLGMTQRGRIEAARAGIRLNTDAIDNSAGVNTSDVEVNIKIALATPVRDGRLSFDDRNSFLSAMTDEVASLVLRNNYLQTLALSLAERRGAADLGFQARLMQVLGEAGRLDRALEYLPDRATVEARRSEGAGLTRPELAVLLAYAKLALHDELLDSAVPDDPYLSRELDRYFPAPLRDRFPDAVAGHRLRREIIATQLSNAIVNRGGPAVVTRLVDETGATAPIIAAAYAATRDSFGLPDLNGGIDALDGRIAGALQLDLYGRVQDLTLSRAVWFIRNVDFAERGLDEVVGLYGQGIRDVEAALDTALSEAALKARQERTDPLVAAGVPADLARRIASLPDVARAPDIVFVARRAERPVAEIASTYFALDGAFGFGALALDGWAIPTVDHYDRLARDRAIDALGAAHRRLAAEIVGRDGAGAAAVEAWTRSRAGIVERIKGAVDGIRTGGLTVSKLTVAASLLGDLTKD